jgi:hypothetical protein
LLFAGGRLKTGAEIAPPAMLMVGPGRAVPGSQMEEWKGAGGRPMIKTWSNVALWISNHAAELGILEAAMSYPFRRSAIDYSAGINLQLPPYATLKAAAYALDASAAAAIHQGDFDGALSNLRAMRQLERDLAEDPVLIQQLVRLSCAGMVNRRAWDLLQAGDWSDAQLAELQKALSSEDLASAVVRAIEAERAMTLGWLAHVPGTVMNTPMAATPDFAERLLAGVGSIVGRLAWFAWGDRNTAHYLESTQRLLENHRAAARQHSMQAVLSDPRLAPSAPTGMNWLRTRVARSLVPATENHMRRAFHCETERSLTDCGIALRRFHLVKGRLPENLDELVPEYLEQVPIDRMDGRPLRYRLNGDDAFVLWSIGDDLKDGGGDGTWEKHSGNDPSLWIGKDAVWPRAASPDEYAVWLKAPRVPAAAPVVSATPTEVTR